MDFTQAVALSFAMALVATFVLARTIRGKRQDRLMSAVSDSVEQQELRYFLLPPGELVNRLGVDRAVSMLQEDLPLEPEARKGLWWYLRRRIATELTRRGAVSPDVLEAFYGLSSDGESGPDDLARVRQAVLSYMCGPDRSLFPFDDVETRPPMPLKLFLLCRDSEEPHPVEYPGIWYWMKVSEFASVTNPNKRLGEHFVLEPPDMGRDGVSAHARFRWGTPPGVYLQDVEVRKMGDSWFVHSIRDTFKLR